MKFVSEGGELHELRAGGSDLESLLSSARSGGSDTVTVPALGREALRDRTRKCHFSPPCL